MPTAAAPHLSSFLPSENHSPAAGDGDAFTKCPMVLPSFLVDFLIYIEQGSKSTGSPCHPTLRMGKLESAKKLQPHQACSPAHGCSSLLPPPHQASWLSGLPGCSLRASLVPSCILMLLFSFITLSPLGYICCSFRPPVPHLLVGLLRILQPILFLL